MAIKPFILKADTLNPDESLQTEINVQKDRKHLSFSCDLDTLGDGKVILGHGYKTTYGSWIEIGAKTLSAYSYYSFKNPSEQPIFPETEHGLDISTFLKVSIDVDVEHGGVLITLATPSGMYQTERMDGWSGCNGTICAVAENCTLQDVTLNWYTDNYAKEIWVIGDSYLSFYNPDRWPYYLYKDGYTNLIICGRGGMKGSQGLEELKQALTKGTPKFLIWHLGANDGDSKWTESLTEEQIKLMTDNFTFSDEIGGTEINQSWMDTTMELMKICKEKGINLIFVTVPSNPLLNHEPKNNWIRNSGYRYIDIAKAVGADENLHWYDGMLYTDNVHPTAKGAIAMYMQMLTDFPEIMNR